MLRPGINAIREMTGQSLACRAAGLWSVEIPSPIRVGFFGGASMDLSAIILVVIVLLGLSGVRIANQYERAVVLRLGQYQAIREPGLYWIAPVLERQVTVTCAP